MNFKNYYLEYLNYFVVLIGVIAFAIWNSYIALGCGFFISRLIILLNSDDSNKRDSRSKFYLASFALILLVVLKFCVK